MLYVEELIGPNTVNTVPPATLDAFRDHGKLRDSLEENVDDARRVLEELEKSGISLDAITAELVKDGVKLFADASDKLYGAVAHKRATLLGGGIDAPELSSCQPISTRPSRRARSKSGAPRQSPPALAATTSGLDRRGRSKWLGWLNVPSSSRRRRLRGLCPGREADRNFTDAVLLGMGGSSLGPEVLAETFGARIRLPQLHVLDSTDPAQVRTMESKVDIAKTLFIVSSKSGSTLEPNVMKDYFFDRVARRSAPPRPAIASSPLPIPARRWKRPRTSRAFAASSTASPSIGGRYSVLSPFGLVPAAATGIDVRSADRARRLDGALLRRGRAAAENPGVRSALAMGLAGPKAATS